jgi:hypothetical protein
MNRDSDAHGVREIGVLRIGLRRLFQHCDVLDAPVMPRPVRASVQGSRVRTPHGELPTLIFLMTV